MMVEILQRLVIVALSIVYPTYKTIRVLRKQEAPQLKIRLIKYW